MQINEKLNAQIVRAVQVSMRIEGYPPTQSKQVKEEAKKLMERRRVQVSLPGQ
jgi:hypothetical protein